MPLDTFRFFKKGRKLGRILPAMVMILVILLILMACAGENVTPENLQRATPQPTATSLAWTLSPAPNASPLPDYKIKNVIQAYGNPSHVIATLVLHQPEENHPWYQVYFIYSSQGFLLTNQFPTMPVLGPELELDAPIFFEPGLNNLNSLRLVDYDLSRLAVPWQGFKDFRFYCRPVNFPLGETGDNCNRILGK